MGLIDALTRLTIAVLSLGAGVLSFAAGDQHRAIDRGDSGYASGIHPFVGSRLKSEMTSAAQSSSPNVDQRSLRQLATIAPLDPLPFELKLVEAIASGDTEATRNAAELVLRYQPRSLAARLQLLNLAAQQADYAVVFEQYEGLVRLKSLNDGLLTDALIGVFRQSGDWSPLLDYLNTMPPRGEILVRKLLVETISIDDIDPIIRQYPSAQDVYLEKLLRDGYADQAYSLWKSFAGLREQDRIASPFNGSFMPREELPPFNWSSSYNRAELQPNGGLYVTYLGSGRPDIIEQTMVAPAGTYVLQTTAKGRMPTNGGALEWSVFCYGATTPLARSVIALERPMETETFEATVQIPEDECNYQILRLRGRTGAFPKTSRTEILSVALIPAN